MKIAFSCGWAAGGGVHKIESRTQERAHEIFQSSRPLSPCDPRPELMAAGRLPVLWDYAVDAQPAAGKMAEQWVQLAQLKAQDGDVSQNSIRLLMQSDSQNLSRLYECQTIMHLRFDS